METEGGLVGESSDEFVAGAQNDPIGRDVKMAGPRPAGQVSPVVVAAVCKIVSELRHI